MEVYLRFVPDDSPQDMPELPENPAGYCWWGCAGLLSEEEYQTFFPNGQDTISANKAVSILIQRAIEQGDNE